MHVHRAAWARLHHGSSQVTHVQGHTCTRSHMHKVTHVQGHTCTRSHVQGHTCTRSHTHKVTHVQGHTCTRSHMHKVTCTRSHMYKVEQAARRSSIWGDTAQIMPLKWVGASLVPTSTTPPQTHKHTRTLTYTHTPTQTRTHKCMLACAQARAMHSQAHTFPAWPMASEFAGGRPSHQHRRRGGRLFSAQDQLRPCGPQNVCRPTAQAPVCWGRGGCGLAPPAHGGTACPTPECISASAHARGAACVCTTACQHVPSAGSSACPVPCVRHHCLCRTLGSHVPSVPLRPSCSPPCAALITI